MAQACCVTLILDETYAGLEFSGSASTGPLLGEATGVIRIGSFSKRFAQPGLRIGYVIAGAKTCRQMADINWVLAMSPCVSSQLAAADLLMAEVKNPGRIKTRPASLKPPPTWRWQPLPPMGLPLCDRMVALCSGLNFRAPKVPARNWSPIAWSMQA
ncbi:aminotransferase class I/II-fold pyridoxal phosphate-dependent enzyme [Rhizobium beringeri]